MDIHKNDLQKRVTNERSSRARLRRKRSAAGSREPGAAARGLVAESRRTIADFVVSHPTACLGVALWLGIALGWWIKRR